MPIGSASSEDRLIWPLVSNGNYTVKTGYRFNIPLKQIDHSRSSSSHCIQPSLWKSVWSIKAAPKIRVFLWKAMHGALPISWNLFKRNMASSASCSACGFERETIEHCLLHCPVIARRVWFSSHLSYCSTLTVTSTIDDWWMKIRKLPHFSSPGMLSMTDIAYILYEIWKARCKFMYDAVTMDPLRINICAVNSINEFNAQCTTQEKAILEPIVPCTCWKKPPSDVIKINTDGAWLSVNGNGGLGVILRDHHGSMIGGCCTSRSSNSAVECEAFAVILAMEFALSRNHLNIIIESDCSSLISSIKSSSCNDWRLHPYLEQITKLGTLLTTLSWDWIPRKANRVADAAAKLAMRRSHFLEWTTNPPSPLFSVLRNDGLPCPHNM